jgi:hypothetical protein
VKLEHENAMSSSPAGGQVHIYGAGCRPPQPSTAPYDQFFIPELRPAPEMEADVPAAAAADGDAAAQEPAAPVLPLRPATCVSHLLGAPAPSVAALLLALRSISNSRCVGTVRSANGAKAGQVKVYSYPHKPSGFETGNFCCATGICCVIRW